MRLILFAICFIGALLFTTSSHATMTSLAPHVISLVFVLGGTLFATMISFPIDKVKTVFLAIRRIYSTKRFDYPGCMAAVILAARDYKRFGFKSLEMSAADASSPYLKMGMQLIADNAEWEEIASTVEKEFVFQSLENDGIQRIFRSMAKYAPSFGLAGTIIGLMRIFPQLSDPGSIGGAMSLALLTTLYGVLASNLVFLPLANKLKDTTADDEVMLRFILEALRCIRDREYSVVIEQRLAGVMPRECQISIRKASGRNTEIRAAQNL
jgi:chemotaxis protein MotA